MCDAQDKVRGPTRREYEVSTRWVDLRGVRAVTTKKEGIKYIVTKTRSANKRGNWDINESNDGIHESR